MAAADDQDVFAGVSRSLAAEDVGDAVGDSSVRVLTGGGNPARAGRIRIRPGPAGVDHRAGFVLAQIDGTITVDDLYALSGLSRLDTAKILAELVEQGVIAA